MTSIIQEVERSGLLPGVVQFVGNAEESSAAVVSASACELARGVDARAIIGVTESGFTGRFLSHQRPMAPVYMLSQNASVCRQMALLWGVEPVVQKAKAKGDLLDHAPEEVKKAGFVKKGDRVVVVAGRPAGSRINIVQTKTA
jgi:pyruvate kinase